jgi:hypothetical protein
LVWVILVICGWSAGGEVRGIESGLLSTCCVGDEVAT